MGGRMHTVAALLLALALLAGCQYRIAWRCDRPPGCMAVGYESG